MKDTLDLVESCEARLASLGFELVDLGADLESDTHLYSLFDCTNGDLVSQKLLSMNDVVDFIEERESRGSVSEAGLQRTFT